MFALNLKLPTVKQRKQNTKTRKYMGEIKREKVRNRNESRSSYVVAVSRIHNAK